jgi:hypothetical protein
MNQDKSPKFMDFMMNALENMEMQIHGNTLQIYLIFYL